MKFSSSEKGNVLECGTAPGKIIAMLQRTKELKVIGLDISVNTPKVAKKETKKRARLCRYTTSSIS